MIQSPSRTKWK